jgi:hypothetical protein
MKANRAKIAHFAVIAVLFVIGIFSESTGLTLLQLLQVQKLFTSAPPNYPAALTFLALGGISLTAMFNLVFNPRLMPKRAG